MMRDSSLVLPYHSRFRCFKINRGGKWVKIRHRVKSEQDFVKHVGSLDNVFYSVSTWLNPVIVRTKGSSGSYKIADNLLLGSDLVFDIDCEGVPCWESLDLARKSANNLYECMKSFGDYEFEYLSFTGLKGFRLVYIDKHDLPVDPVKRIGFVEQNRKVFILELRKLLVEKRFTIGFYNTDTIWDEKVTLNIMNVIRVLGTIHTGTGFYTTKLPVSCLKKDIKKIINHVPYNGKRRPVILHKEMIEVESEVSPRLRLLQKGGDVSGLASSSTYFYFSNRVIGCKNNFVPVFVYDTNRWKRELEKIGNKYSLGNIYVFKSDDKYVCVSLKVMQRRALQKVFNQTTSSSKHLFKLHGRVLFPVFLSFIKKLRFELTGDISNAHNVLVRGVDEGLVLSGDEKMEIIKTVGGE